MWDSPEQILLYDLSRLKHTFYSTSEEPLFLYHLATEEMLQSVVIPTLRDK
jgi:uncharacterized protein YqcC (DUF446 family)